VAKALIIENGKRFNMLTVLNEEERHNKQRQFLCRCDCGDIRVHKLILLTSGQSKSCGCLRKKTFIDRNTSHGKSRSKLNAVYQAMKQRCENPNNINYKHYGGRGIKVCEQWLSSLIVFYNWAIENGYEEGLSIDRINVNGNYEPDNCQWVKMKIQTRNKRDNVFVEYNGEKLCVQDWANRLGINHCTLTKRLKKWGLEKALTTAKIEINDTKSNRNRQ
jgi:hypothetical protein